MYQPWARLQRFQDGVPGRQPASSVRRALRGWGAPFCQRPQRAQTYLSLEELPTATLGGAWGQPPGCVEPDCWRGSTLPACLPVVPVSALPQSVTGCTSAEETKTVHLHPGHVTSQPFSQPLCTHPCAHGPCLGSGAQDEARAPEPWEGTCTEACLGLLSW